MAACTDLRSVEDLAIELWNSFAEGRNKYGEPAFLCLCSGAHIYVSSSVTVEKVPPTPVCIAVGASWWFSHQVRVRPFIL